MIKMLLGWFTWIMTRMYMCMYKGLLGLAKVEHPNTVLIFTIIQVAQMISPWSLITVNEIFASHSGPFDLRPFHLTIPSILRLRLSVTPALIHVIHVIFSI